MWHMDILNLNLTSHIKVPLVIYSINRDKSSQGIYATAIRPASYPKTARSCPIPKTALPPQPRTGSLPLARFPAPHRRPPRARAAPPAIGPSPPLVFRLSPAPHPGSVLALKTPLYAPCGAPVSPRRGPPMATYSANRPGRGSLSRVLMRAIWSPPRVAATRARFRPAVHMTVTPIVTVKEGPTVGRLAALRTSLVSAWNK